MFILVEVDILKPKRNPIQGICFKYLSGTTSEDSHHTLYIHLTILSDHMAEKELEENYTGREDSRLL